MVAVQNCSPVAQSAERVAVNHLVGGSSPSRGVSVFKGLANLLTLYFLEIV